MIPLDKQAHFWSGLALMLSASLFFGWGLGLCIAVVAGLAKEWYDSLGYGTPDILDAVATSVGAVFGVILYVMHELLA